MLMSFFAYSIVNHVSLERIFKLKNQFLDKAREVLSNERFQHRIINFNQLKEDILSNSHYIRRISKLGDTPDNALEFLNRNDSVRDVIQEFNLDIEIDDNGNYVYENKTQVSNFINFMQDSYYLTFIRGERGTDVRR